MSGNSHQRRTSRRAWDRTPLEARRWTVNINHVRASVEAAMARASIWSAEELIALMNGDATAPASRDGVITLPYLARAVRHARQFGGSRRRDRMRLAIHHTAQLAPDVRARLVDEDYGRRQVLRVDGVDVEIDLCGPDRAALQAATMGTGWTYIEDTGTHERFLNIARREIDEVSSLTDEQMARVTGAQRDPWGVVRLNTWEREPMPPPDPQRLRRQRAAVVSKLRARLAALSSPPGSMAPSLGGDRAVE